MILRRLYELARRENLLEDPAFESLPVRFAIQIDDDGTYLGLVELHGPAREVAAKGKGDKPAKALANKGKPLSVPLQHGSPNARGFARFFADAMSRILPVTFDLKDPDGAEGIAEQEKRDRSRSTFWEQIHEAAAATADPALLAVEAFGRRLDDDDLVARINKECADLGASTLDRCTFAWQSQRGRTILEHEPVRAWYRTYFRAWTGTKQESGPLGLCQVTGEFGPIPTTHPMKIQGVPGGLPTGVSLVSFDKDAFQSYGLDGTANAAIGYDATDDYCRALTALIGERLTGSPRSKIRFGDGVFLFWTREPASNVGLEFLEQPDPAEVERLISSAHAGRDVKAPPDVNAFYGLTLSGNAARAIVRGYLEMPLPEATRNLGRWFEDLRIAAVEKGGAVAPMSAFPLWMLATSTALKAEDVAPDVYPRLLDAALGDGPLPDTILASCLRRLRAEGGEGFRPTRLSLIKLTLKRRNRPVTEALEPDQTKPAYLCGRLLSVFEDIQYAALGEVNASVVDKFYGTFSSAPTTVFARLFANATNHLRKLKSEDYGAFLRLDKLLTGIVALLEKPPSGVLSLIDQGWFALGYYHQKAHKWEQIAEAKARKTKAAEAAKS
ncbi:MAG: type I-C CRISPR-associated protein Cas8c/Csd1 [Isosphaeraceae bacterium]